MSYLRHWNIWKNVSWLKKKKNDEKTRNKTSYILLEKGLKTNKILYELSVYALNELESSKLDCDFKNEILKNYVNCLNLD